MRRCLRVGTVVAAVLAVAALAIGAAAVDKAALDAALKNLSAFDYGQDRSALDQIDAAINASKGDAAVRKEIESRLIALLGSKASRGAKDYACRKLQLIGLAESVPALAALLPDKDLSHMARYALERMPYPEAGNALRDALATTGGLVRVGIINSLGMRGDLDAVAALTGLLNDPDAETAAAAAVALGRSGTPAGATALADFRAKAPKPLQVAAVDASLDVAQRLLAKGESEEAAKVYEALDAQGQPACVRLAAFRGLVAARPAQAVPRLLKALGGDDPVLRTQAAQLVAETRGAEATKAFADALAGLPPSGQVALLGALGARGDAAARPAILEAAKSKDAAVRAAAAAALATTGNAADVPLLAALAASSEAETAAAARLSLARLKGDGVDEAIVAALGGAAPAVRAELVRCLAARSARGCVGAVVERLADADQPVRLAALETLAELGGAEQAAVVVKALKAAKDDAERSAAEKTLLAVCGRAREGSADAVLAGLEGADAATRAVLLHALGRVGGAKALAAVRAAVADKDEPVQDAAVRALSDWPDLAAAEPLIELARSAAKTTHQVLALRGYVRLVDLEKSDGAKMKMIDAASPLAKRPAEKKLILGALGGVHTPEALKRIMADLDEPALAEEACVAAVQVGRAIAGRNKPLVREALAAVVEKTKNRRTRQDAQKILGGVKK